MTSSRTAIPVNRIMSAHLPEIFPGIDQGLDLKLNTSLFSFAPAAMPLLLPYEYLVLAAIVRYAAPKRLLEFGTAIGRSTLILAANSPADAIVTTIDLPQSQMTNYSYECLEGQRESGGLLKSTEYQSKIRHELLDSRSLDGERIRESWSAMDFILIDGDHSYSGVRSDSETALALAHPESILMWHDYYIFPDYVVDTVKDRGVFRYLNELSMQTGIVLYHILGTYFVVGSTKALTAVVGTVSQPADMKTMFGQRIVRLSDAIG